MTGNWRQRPPDRQRNCPPSRLSTACARRVFVLLAVLLCSFAQVDAQSVSPSRGGTNDPYVTPEEIQKGFRRLPRPSPQQQVERDRRAEIEAAEQYYEEHPDDFGHAESFLEGYDYLQVRLPTSTRQHDAAIKYQARIRVGLHFAFERPQPLGMTVVAADFSPRPDVQRQISTEFQQVIPRARRTQGAGLSGLLRGEAGARPTVAQIQSALAAEGADVVMIVGHIDPDTDSMTRTERGRPVRIDIPLWHAAADRARVVLVPLGCFSANCAPIGSRHAINSRQIFAAVAATIASEPPSFGEMFGRLTTDAAMTLTLDPFTANLGYEKFDMIVEGRSIGQIWWNPDLPSGGGPPECGVSRDFAAYRNCADRAASAVGTALETEGGAFGEGIAPPSPEPAPSGEAPQHLGLIIVFAAALLVAAVPAAVAFQIAGWKLDEDETQSEEEAETGGFQIHDASNFRAFRDAFGTLFLLHFAGLAAVVGDLGWSLALGAVGLFVVAAAAALLLWQGLRGGAPWKAWLGTALAISAGAYAPLLVTASTSNAG